MSRRNRRSGQDRFLLFGRATGKDWRVVRAITYAEGQRLMDGGFYMTVHERGRLIGFQPKGSPATGQARPAPSRQDPASLGVREMRAMAGEMGKSRTAGMPEQSRINRVHPKSGRLLAEEDAVELATVKVGYWPISANHHGDKATRVYPKAVSAR